jgi:hypothetical protein
MHPMLLLGDEAQVKARFGPFGDSVSVTAGSEIILAAANGTDR